MTTSQDFIYTSDLNVLYFSSEAVTLIAKLSRTRRSSSDTFACQKLHSERKKMRLCCKYLDGPISFLCHQRNWTVTVGPSGHTGGLPARWDHLLPRDMWEVWVQYIALLQFAPVHKFRLPQLNPATHNIHLCVYQIRAAHIWDTEVSPAPVHDAYLGSV